MFQLSYYFSLSLSLSLSSSLFSWLRIQDLRIVVSFCLTIYICPRQKQNRNERIFSFVTQSKGSETFPSPVNKLLHINHIFYIQLWVLLCRFKNLLLWFSLPDQIPFSSASEFNATRCTEVSHQQNIMKKALWSHVLTSDWLVGRLFNYALSNTDIS